MRFGRWFVTCAALCLAVSCSSSAKEEGASQGRKRGATTTTQVIAPVSGKGKAAADASFCRQYAEIVHEGSAVAADTKDAALIRQHYGRISTIAEGIDTSDAAVDAAARQASTSAKEAADAGSLTPFQEADATAAVKALSDHARDRCVAR